MLSPGTVLIHEDSSATKLVGFGLKSRKKIFNAVPLNSIAMSRQKPPLIVKVSSTVDTAITDCRIYTN